MGYESQTPWVEHGVVDDFNPDLVSGGGPGPEEQVDEADVLQAPVPLEDEEIE